MKIVSQRTSTPFSGGLSPATQKSVQPFNNVPQIQDFLDGTTKMTDILPGGGGDWSPGEDKDKSYKEKGDDYKRQDKDAQIIANMLDKGKEPQQQWKVKVRGGSKSFISLNLAEKYAARDRRSTGNAHLPMCVRTFKKCRATAINVITFK